MLFLERFDDDTVLLEAFLAEDGEADAYLFRRYYKPLVLFAERVTGSLADAEDVVADVFAKMLGKRQAFEKVENLQAYLYAATRNAAINRGRKEAAAGAAHGQAGYHAQFDPASEEALSKEMIEGEVVQAIYREIEELPEQAQKIFKLIFIHHLSTEEIANQLGISQQTVYSQKSRAAQIIRTALLKKNKVLSLLFFVFILSEHT